MKNIFYLLIFVFLYACTSTEVDTVVNNELSQWRGENRDGIYNETGLLQEWPEDGPELIWFTDSVGNGYGSPVVSSEQIYICGAIDSVAYVYALNFDGSLKWTSKYGDEWGTNYVGSRCSPTVVGDLMYVCSGKGDIACLETKTGAIKWSKNLLRDFNGRNLRFGYSQSPLVNDSVVYYAPGGVDTNFVALDRFTGETIWISEGKHEISAYCSPMLIDLPARDIIVTFCETSLIGFDAKDGSLLWENVQDTFCDIHANTPYFENGFIYYSTACGSGIVKLQLSEDGTSVTEIWKNNEFNNYMSGVVKVGNKLIGGNLSNRKWEIVDAETGARTDSIELGRGVTIYADNKLYCYTEKGRMALVEIIGDSLNIVSEFKITKGDFEHFAHPVIKNGVLYVRHGKTLMAYNIKKPEEGSQKSE